MQHRLLGNGQLELPVVTFGAWAIGGLFWGGSDDEDAIRAIQTALDNGVDAIDTAPIYGCGHSEEIVGRAIRGRRDQVRILTKCGIRWDTTDGDFHFTIPAPGGGEVTAYRTLKRASILSECDESLRRLGVETIDLYQIHAPASNASAEETMGAMLDLKRQGKIREIGVSNYSTAQLEEACRFAPVVSNQIKYNLLERDIESDPLPFCRKNNIGVICFSPMALGLLTGKVTMDTTYPEGSTRNTNPCFQPARRAQAIRLLDSWSDLCEKYHCTKAQLVIALTARMIPGLHVLCGARTPEQAIDNAGALHIALEGADAVQMKWDVDAIS